MAKTLTDAGLSVVALNEDRRATRRPISNIRGSSMSSNMPSAANYGSRFGERDRHR